MVTRSALKLSLCLFSLGAATRSFAIATGFNDSLFGISMGAGLQPSFGLSGAQNFDPIPGLSPSATGTRDSVLIPTRFGLFYSRPTSQIEVFARYMVNSHDPWVSGTGQGYTNFGSYGVGLQISGAFYTHNRFRLSGAGIAEYVLEKASLEYTPSGGATESIRISSNETLLGGGLQGEIYLGDMWGLSLLAAYEYGLPATWSVSTGGTFLGANRSGALTDGSGNPENARFGGFLIELSFHLVFHSGK